MKINDLLFGENDITEEILIEIMSSEAMKRIKGVTQQGLPSKYYGTPTFSRYDHSMGVFLGLRKLGASLKEQIAGLTHDVSHTTFSHLIDHVLGDPSKDNYQDDIHMKVMEDSDLPAILSKHGIDFREISEHEQYKLLESPIPELCMDRFDYACRDFLIVSQNSGRLERVVNGIINHNGSMAFNSIESAEEFSMNYVDSQTRNWTSKERRSRYHIFADALKIALQKGFVKEEDFLKTEDYVFEKIIHKEKRIDYLLSMLEDGFKVSEVQIGGIPVQFKVRYVDPAVHNNGETRKLSELSKGYKRVLEEQRRMPSEKRFLIEEYSPITYQ